MHLLLYDLNKNILELNICFISLLQEKAETFFSHTESTIFVRHSSEYETSDNDRKVSWNIYQMRIDPRDKRNTVPDWPQGLANGHLFTHCLVEESKGENELFLFT